MTTRSGRASHLHQSAPLALPGRRGVWSGVGGRRRLEGPPIPSAEAARVCSIPLLVCAYPLYRHRSWEHRPGPSPFGSQRIPPTPKRSSASWSMTVPARCRVRSAGRAASPLCIYPSSSLSAAPRAALPALFAITASHSTPPLGTTDHPSSLAVPSLAVVPPAAASSRAGLIEQSNRSDRLSIRPSSTTAGRAIPAGVTQGEGN